MLPISFFMCRGTISSIRSRVSCFFTCEPYLDEQNPNDFFPGAVISGGQLTISVHTLTTSPIISETAQTTEKKNEKSKSLTLIKLLKFYFTFCLLLNIAFLT